MQCSPSCQVIQILLVPTRVSINNVILSVSQQSLSFSPKSVTFCERMLWMMGTFIDLACISQTSNDSSMVWLFTLPLYCFHYSHYCSVCHEILTLLIGGDWGTPKFSAASLWERLPSQSIWHNFSVTFKSVLFHLLNCFLLSTDMVILLNNKISCTTQWWPITD
jgi:hypothetical protein